MRYRRFEVFTTGVDEATQGVSTDPFLPSSVSTVSGLRIPPVLAADSTPQSQPRYLFLLAQRNISRSKTVVLGIRQGLKIGADVAPSGGEGTQLSYPEELLVRTPDFRFIDGNVSWHLVREPNDVHTPLQKSTNAANWSYQTSQVPAMLYETFTNTSVDPLTGAPAYYAVGLTAYTPPALTAWQPIAGLGNLKDVRFPWEAPTDSQGIREEVEGSCKISLYASVLQTNPATRLQPVLPAVSATYPPGLSPESAFINSLVVNGRSIVTFRRVFGSILFEDSEADISLRDENK